MHPAKKTPRNAWAAALPACLPVIFGYLFAGFAMGLLAQQAGYAWWVVLLMDLLLYAGAMQFLAVELFLAGSGWLQIAAITLFVQSRHAFYGLSLLARCKQHWQCKPYMLFSLTDEAYALHTTVAPPPGIHQGSYDLAVAILLHSSWAGGNMLGVLFGSLLHIPLEGLDFAMTALFIATCVEQWRSAKSHIPAAGAAVLSIVMLLWFGADHFMLPALASLVLMLFVFRRPIQSKMPLTAQEAHP